MNGQWHWNKGEIAPLGQHFNSTEFSCQCSHYDCIYQMVERSLIDKLDALRNDIGMPIKITSGFRCAKHQADLMKTPGIETVAKSTHELGQAADIKCPVPIDDLEKNAARYFKAIGVGITFLHLDLRIDKPIRRWKYNY